MLCWGSWANTQKMSGKWRFELFYFDYAFGVLLAAVICALTLGSLGYDGFSFLDDLMNGGKRYAAMGFGAGMIFNLANMLLVAAITVAGLAVAFPVGIGLALSLIHISVLDDGRGLPVGVRRRLGSARPRDAAFCGLPDLLPMHAEPRIRRARGLGGDPHAGHFGGMVGM